ncbi:transcription factor CYCLOIDEA-like [Cocos nucifera]|uniref:Transcription factor CYCLOIDEA-like n=1 Tax=Cocos nucifera TaxID=13894 RepID=A0A8K0IGL9_COCNU|nr:transcription factor CYCLOIDEA-like [Cocos nucifera]
MISYPNTQYLAESYFVGDEDQGNPPSIPKDGYPSFSTFPLSPPTFDHDLLITAHLTITNTLEAPTFSSPDPAEERDMTANAPPATRNTGRRKRPFRTDRHSKIFTAQGLRDRRMRLSQEVASKFFSLQDLLGFDKASQTVDWLLTRSKSAIQQLIDASQLGNQSINLSSLVSESSTSDCFSTISNDKQKSPAASPNTKDIGLRPLSIASSDPILTKEMRDMARARARERTREKNRIRSGRPEGSCQEDRPSSENDAVKGGELCINGVHQPSPMTMVPSSLMYDTNNTIRLSDERMNINFPKSY